MSVRRVAVDVAGVSYEVLIGPGLLAEAGRFVKEASGAAAAGLITDEVVANHYGISADASLARAGMRVVSRTVPAGEPSKSWTVAGLVLEELAAARLDRTDVVVALGGGVVGDLAGFCAGVYLRGISFVQAPTTLLAMVDSSVGGKTGVDLAAGKNLAGVFKQPLLVIADTDTLATVPEVEWRSGLAEVAKTAVLSGEEFVAWMETRADALTARETEAVSEAIERCVRFKAGVVARDEREEGPRECLNYGHTLGHALERTLGYGRVPHGIAVAEGMRFAARVAIEVGEADAAFAKRQDRLLDALGLDALGLDAAAPGARPALLLDAMKGDKKARSGTVRMVLVTAPGQWSCRPVADATMLAHLEAWAKTKQGE